MSEITIIIANDENIADIDDDLGAGGIRVFAGRLTLEQIDKLTQSADYPERAVMWANDDQGKLAWVEVTFSNKEGERPSPVSVAGMAGAAGFLFTDLLFTDEHTVGKLSFNVHFSTLQTID